MLAPLLALRFAPSYRIVDLGVPPNAEQVEAVDINRAGDVLVNASERGYIWRNGVFTDIGRSPYAMNGDRVEPRAFNNRGDVVGACGSFEAIFNSGSSDQKAFVRRKGRMAVVFPGDGMDEEANDINDWGDIVGNHGKYAYAFVAGKDRGIPALSHAETNDSKEPSNDPNWVAVSAINNQRVVLVTSTYGGLKKGQVDDLPFRPLLVNMGAGRWRMRKVPLPKGFRNGAGLAINDAGDVLVAAIHPLDMSSKLYLWRRGTITMLPMERDPVNLEAASMNDRDDIVSSNGSHSSVDARRPLLWLNGQAVKFPTFEGWSLKTATGINDRREICGTGVHEGKTRAYILVPNTPSGSKSRAPIVRP